MKILISYLFIIFEIKTKMDCENCTHTISVPSINEGDSLNESNCIIVLVVSLAFAFGLYKLLRIIVRIMGPLSWIPYDLKKRYSSDEINTWALVTGGS